jgi:DNA modification methylase
VGLIVTSPPYNQGIEKFKPSGMHREGDWVSKVGRLAYSDSMPEQKYQEWQKSLLDIWHSIIRDGGSVFYNHKNRYREKRVVSPFEWLPGKFNLRQEIIWRRPGSVTQNARMFLPCDERVFWLYKGRCLHQALAGFTGQKATLEGDGRTFDEIAAERLSRAA